MNEKNLHTAQWTMALLMVAGLLLTACDDTGITDARDNVRELRLVMGATEPDDVNATRALPTGFLPYGSIYNTATGLPSQAKIQCYLCDNTDEVSSGIFAYSDEAGVRSWNSRISLESNGTYFFYGFLPKESVSNASIAPLNGDYSNGAVITMLGLDAVTPADICVVVGAKDFQRADDSTPLPAIESYTWSTGSGTEDMASRLAKFDVLIENKENYIYLLADHIYSSLHFKMSIDETYSKLRTIKIKKVTLMTSNAETPVKTVDVVVTLIANNGNLHPMKSTLSGGAGGTVAITPAEMGVTDNPAVLYDNATSPLVLTTTAQSIRGCFAPSTNRTFILETLYDVYDRKGNLIREDETSVNTFVVVNSAMTYGKEYTYTIHVAPTYLYTLSGPDLDNPTFTISN